MSNTSSFLELGLPSEICETLAQIGYTKPSEIQAQAIPVLLRGKDNILALAQTGTGKTAAFGLPLLTHIANLEPATYALVLCPTRELCLQIYENLSTYSKSLPELRILAVYGGVPISKQLLALKKPIQIIVATPGRLQDLLDRKALNLNQVKYAILDEADEMLNMGFRDEIISVLELLPKDKLVWLFSASMQDSIRHLVKKVMLQKPVEIQVSPANSTNRNIQHRYFLTSNRHKYEALERLLLCSQDLHAVIFCRTKNDTQSLAYKLKERGFDVDYINGDMAQNERESIMNKYKNHLINILVATDVVARGIDVRDVTHVINYDFPDDYEVYTHRSGRTARAGKLGFCYTILTVAENYKIPRIESLIRDKIHLEQIPSIEDVQQAMLRKANNTIKQMANSIIPELHEFLSKNAEPLNYDPKILEILLYQSLLGDKFMDKHQSKLDINLKPRINNFSSHAKDVFAKKNIRKSPRNFRENTSKAEDLIQLSINLGRQDGFKTKLMFMNWLQKELPFIYRGALGRVNLEEKRASFELPHGLVNRVKGQLELRTYKGVKIRVG